jgi:hypothetical protein
MISWSIINSSLALLWSKYWDLKESYPEEAIKLKDLICKFTNQIKS